jgi:hypothetical protein
MAWAKESKQELVIMLLNFENAYDKVYKQYHPLSYKF